MKIEVKLPENVQLKHLTGAAARSVAAADAAAESALARAKSAADALVAALSEPEVNAGMIARAIRARQSLEEAGKFSHLAPRWRKPWDFSGLYKAGNWWENRGFHTYASPDNAARSLADEYSRRLADAGVILPSGGGIYTPEFWDDAAAMGC